jgi:hypothetical protein
MAGHGAQGTGPSQHIFQALYLFRQGFFVCVVYHDRSFADDF